MGFEINRNLGEQPLVAIMEKHNLKPHDIVAASEDQMTHKMVTRGKKGRLLTPNVQKKILAGLNKATGESYVMEDIFNY